MVDSGDGCRHCRERLPDGRSLRAARLGPPRQCHGRGGGRCRADGAARGRPPAGAHRALDGDRRSGRPRRRRLGGAAPAPHRRDQRQPAARRRPAPHPRGAAARACAPDSSSARRGGSTRRSQKSTSTPRSSSLGPLVRAPPSCSSSWASTTAAPHPDRHRRAAPGGAARHDGGRADGDDRGRAGAVGRRAARVRRHARAAFGPSRRVHHHLLSVVRREPLDHGPQRPGRLGAGRAQPTSPSTERCSRRSSTAARQGSGCSRPPDTSSCSTTCWRPTPTRR